MNRQDDPRTGTEVLETEALLQILALGEKQVRAGKVYLFSEAMSLIRARRAALDHKTLESQSKRRKRRE